MANDVLGRGPSPLVGAFSADASRLFFGAENQAGCVVQNLSIGYNQSVRPLFEIGSNNRYYVVGRTMGNMQIGRIIGPGVFLSTILEALGNPCSGVNRLIQLQLGNSACAPGSLAREVRLFMDACIAMSIEIRTEAEQLLVNEMISIMFGQLSRSDPSALDAANEAEAAAEAAAAGGDAAGAADDFAGGGGSGGDFGDGVTAFV